MPRVEVQTIHDFDRVRGDLLNEKLQFEDMETHQLQAINPAAIRYYTCLMIDERDENRPGQLDLVDAVTLPNVRLRTKVRVRTRAGVDIERDPSIITRLIFDESV